MGDVVGALKSITTYEYVVGVREKGWARFDRRLWQRNYYERVIRNEREWTAIREYIVNNPLNWALDQENPQTHLGRTF